MQARKQWENNLDKPRTNEQIPRKTQITETNFLKKENLKRSITRKGIE